MLESALETKTVDKIIQKTFLAPHLKISWTNQPITSCQTHFLVVYLLAKGSFSKQEVEMVLENYFQYLFYQHTRRLNCNEVH